MIDKNGLSVRLSPHLGFRPTELYRAIVLGANHPLQHLPKIHTHLKQIEPHLETSAAARFPNPSQL